MDHPVELLLGGVLGLLLWFFITFVARGFYAVNQNERAVKTVFGRAERLGAHTTLELPSAQSLRPDERERYAFPQVVVIAPGGPYFKWPWEKIHKVSIATVTTSIAWDPEYSDANNGGTQLAAVTKDQLETRISGQLRFRIAEQNLYAALFGIKQPIAHVLGYFVSVLRQRMASFVAPENAQVGQGHLSRIEGVSINDLRKNLRTLNDWMEQDSQSSSARYGVAFDACLITSIDPPDEVESALAAINTAHNHVSAEVSLAQASADQRITQSRTAVEIETQRVQAEIEPLKALANQLSALQASGPGTLDAYLRSVRLGLLAKAKRVVLEQNP
jgi:regulator of protease activity HflC (stomatin/prohibitin superfamily)